MALGRKIGILGLWHLGEVYSACLAESGHTVIGVSDDSVLIENFKKNIPPLAEPRLAELIDKNQREGRLSYTTDFSEVAKCDVVWLTFDVPVNDDDIADAAIVIESIEKSTPHLKQGVVIAVSSQIPVGTSKLICERIKSIRPELSFGYFYSPENLRLGDAVKCFMEPGRVVIGADSASTLEMAKTIFEPLQTEIISMSPASAEMTKHAMNAWLATSISFTNDIADVCEKTGADVEDVIRALKAEPRVGPKAYLFAGLGFSGGTLGRDIQSLLSTARKYSLELPIIAGVLAKNKARHSVVLTHLEKELGNVQGKTIALFGMTYKSGTSTLRRSQPLIIAEELQKAGAHLRLYDALASQEEVAHFSQSPLFQDVYEAAQGADGAIVLTPDFKLRDIDFKRLKEAMKGNVLVDAQNVLVPKENDIRAAGLTYSSIGR